MEMRMRRETNGKTLACFDALIRLDTGNGLNFMHDYHARNEMVMSIAR